MLEITTFDLAGLIGHIVYVRPPSMFNGNSLIMLTIPLDTRVHQHDG